MGRRVHWSPPAGLLQDQSGLALIMVLHNQLSGLNHFDLLSKGALSIALWHLLDFKKKGQSEKSHVLTDMFRRKVGHLYKKVVRRS